MDTPEAVVDLSKLPRFPVANDLINIHAGPLLQPTQPGKRNRWQQLPRHLGMYR